MIAEAPTTTPRTTVTTSTTQSTTLMHEENNGVTEYGIITPKAELSKTNVAVQTNLPKNETIDKQTSVMNSATIEIPQETIKLMLIGNIFNHFSMHMTKLIFSSRFSDYGGRFSRFDSWTSVSTRRSGSKIAIVSLKKEKATAHRSSVAPRRNTAEQNERKQK